MQSVLFLILCFMFFSILACFLFPGLVVRIHVHEDRITVNYFGFPLFKILLANIQSVQVGDLGHPMELFHGVADSLLTRRFMTNWTWRFVVVKMKPGTGMIKNWVIYSRNSDGIAQDIRSKLSR
jgi:hypothetical protein